MSVHACSFVTEENGKCDFKFSSSLDLDIIYEMQKTSQTISTQIEIEMRNW